MKIFDTDSWQEVWQTITRNRTRSMLTGFGVFWGVFMLIILMGVGSGFRNGVETQREGVNVNSVVFYPDLTGEPYKGYRKGRWWRMDSRDLVSIREKASSVEFISPTLSNWNSSTVRDRKQGSFRSQGVMPDFFEIQRVDMLWGRLLNQIDVDQRRKVCVIGEGVYETLFNKGEDPVGQEIMVDGHYFRVTGVVRARSDYMSVSVPHESVYIPFSTMRQLFVQGDYFHTLMCAAKKGRPAAMVEQEVGAILRANHDIAPTDTKALGSFNVEERLNMIGALFTGVDALVLIVGLGALLSGIIGISNIMLVSVRERTREIGVRRALGARPRDILRQVMSESLVLTALAGVLGFLVGVGLLAAVSQAMQSSSGGMFGPPLISFNLALGAMGILVVSGVAAGAMPAMKALQIKAIDALRDE
jgi:putative ABC transport system permease protein